MSQSVVAPAAGRSEASVTNAVGTISELWRFPVKSMLGEQSDVLELDEQGVVGDRAYALVDADTGKVVSAKNPRLWSQIFGCRANFVEMPRARKPTPPVLITLPDGSAVRSDAPDVDSTMSDLFGRRVTLATSAPDDFTIDDYHPDVNGLGPGRQPDTVTDQKLGAAFFAEAGLPSAVSPGSFLDLFPVSLLTTSTLAQMSSVKPDTRFDVRRFRMNIIVTTAEAGFVENGWLGRALTIGEGIEVAVMIPDPRCVMTTLPQDDLPKDNGVLQTIARYNRVDVAGTGLFPCVGVYAVVTATGTIHCGDRVTLT
jgi:uncharacterized protein YcbX